MTQPKVACPFCGDYRSKVKNTRPSADGVYRRRECLACHRRYSTEETHRRYATPRQKAADHYKPL